MRSGQIDCERCSINGAELCHVSSSFRRSVHLRELILAPGASKRCPITGSYKYRFKVEKTPGLQFGVRLREVSISIGSTVVISLLYIFFGQVNIY